MCLYSFSKIIFERRKYIFVYTGLEWGGVSKPIDWFCIFCMIGNAIIIRQFRSRFGKTRGNHLTHHLRLAVLLYLINGYSY